ncbi:hypothetical protein HPB51_000625 [Rhipicephalus microplus]|uniref:Uncharacterized protein n=1 Tax=Rhipicephalus microplus TaxID=6941 RepID=A0A9J6E4I3_RHIMP|nr:hypothetical protein HPB51_000625 [Rhipicephalus microplus]
MGKASADTEVVAGHTVRTAVEDLLPIHYWQWESFLNTALKGARSFEQSSLVMVENMRYVRKIAVIMGQYELRHLLNFMALCVADELSAFFPESHTRSSQAVRLPYRDRSLPTRPQLCLRLAERTCPVGVEALLLQAVAGTNVREDLVRERFSFAASLIERRHRRHLLNFMALCVADELSAFFPERHARSSQAVRLPYRDRSLPTRPQLCLRFAERTCPVGVEALLLQAVAGTNVREDLVREALPSRFTLMIRCICLTQFSWWIPQFIDTLASHAKRLSWLGTQKASELESLVR